MRTVMLSQLAEWCEGRLIGNDVAIDRIGTDSREELEGAIFVALRGERFDAHEFVSQAEENAASALLLHRPVSTDLPHILCPDTEEALGEIAAGLAAGRHSVVLALTGSNGKTSVKTMLYAIMRHAGKTYANPGNRNNEIGLPLAVIEAPEDAEFAIYEMGAGKPGDPDGGLGQQHRAGPYRTHGFIGGHCRNQRRHLRSPAGRRRGRGQCR
jgi:UDP-N-acetylmuramoyl-tripeptide--D-alanyl-D-alanine ligase